MRAKFISSCRRRAAAAALSFRRHCSPVHLSALFVRMAKDFVSSLLHFDWFLPQTIFSHLRFCSAGSERGFCHGPKETEGEQVSNLSVDFTEGACPRGGTLASYWNPAGRRKQTEGRGTRKQWRQPSI